MDSKKTHKLIDLSGLPRKGKLIDWKSTKGLKVYFEYDNIKGFLIIEEVFIENNYTKLMINFNNKTLKIKASTLKRCPLGSLLNKCVKGFKVEIGTHIKDDNRNLTIIDLEYRLNKYNKKIKWIKYRCNICNAELWIRESNLLSRKQGCSCCHGLTVIEGINDIATTDTWMIPIIGLNNAKKYNHGSTKKINPVCPHCGRKKKKSMMINTIYKNHSIGCVCSDGKSQIEKYMFNMLEQLKENKQIKNFETEIKFNWCTYYNPYKNKETYGIYDFVIENKKIIIETDGGFHRKDNVINGQTKEESQWIDNIKDKLAIEHGLQVIRISDEGDFKENILNSKLNNIFDLNIIDWNKCLEYSCSNLVKIACSYKNNNPNLSSKEIGELMGGYIKSTITQWLKIGNKLGWCHYNSKEEIKKSRNKQGERNIKQLSKKVEIFKEGTSLGVFFNARELDRRSEELFGVKLNYKNISSVCLGKRPQYKGYTFKYLNEYHEEFKPKPKGKAVEIFKNNNSLGVFETVMKLEKHLNKLFGIKLDNSGISQVCNGKIKSYKGYTFKYISREEYYKRISEDPTLKESEQAS